MKLIPSWKQHDNTNPFWAWSIVAIVAINNTDMNEILSVHIGITKYDRFVAAGIIGFVYFSRSC